MPVVLLERLPMPSLRSYTAISVVLLACALYYGNEVVRELTGEGHLSEVKQQEKTRNPPFYDIIRGEGTNKVSFKNNTFESEGYVLDMTAVLLGEPWCVWTLINTAFCCLLLWGKMIQKIVFGDLRVSEQQHIKDKFWNFVFYKFIFIFGVMNVQNMDEVVMWSSWFSMLGFLHLLAQLCKDRFEYLSFSPTTATWTHAKVLALLFAIQTAVACLMLICFFVGSQAGINVLFFMLAESVLLGIRTLYVMIRYAIHLWDLHHDDSVWENRALYIYYSELVFELSALSVDFAHHLHMLLYGNILLSMASLVICMQLRYLFHEFQRRIRRHKNYLRVISSMESRFPMATPEEMEQNNDDCAICWDKMDNARKLPCGHLFHNACLRSWLEQDTSCPTCRMSLSDPQQSPAHQAPTGMAGDAPPAPNMESPPRNQTTTNHFFHFDGSRYVSWLPSFSVEVTHTQILGNTNPPQPPVQTSQLDNMARQVSDVFPNIAVSSILEDLQMTHSVEMTIENILMGHVTSPPGFSSRTPTDILSNPTDIQHQPSAIAHSPDPQPSSSSEDEHEAQPSSSSNSEVTSHASSPVLEDHRKHINFIQDDNLPDLSSHEEEDDLNDLMPNTAGGRFSKSPKEREEMLTKRKESLMEQARKKYLMKIPSMTDSATSVEESVMPSAQYQSRHTLDYHDNQSASSSSNDGQLQTSDQLQRRRELAFQAAQRRMRQSDS